MVNVVIGRWETVGWVTENVNLEDVNLSIYCHPVCSVCGNDILSMFILKGTEIECVCTDCDIKMGDF